MPPRDKNSGNVGGCGEKLGHWKIPRLGCPGCFWSCGGDFDLLG